jgi:hypothetical protein
MIWVLTFGRHFQNLSPRVLSSQSDAHTVGHTKLWTAATHNERDELVPSSSHRRSTPAVLIHAEPGRTHEEAHARGAGWGVHLRVNASLGTSCACVRACVCVCVRVCARVCVCLCVHTSTKSDEQQWNRAMRSVLRSEHRSSCPVHEGRHCVCELYHGFIHVCDRMEACWEGHIFQFARASSLMAWLERMMVSDADGRPRSDARWGQVRLMLVLLARAGRVAFAVRFWLSSVVRE